MDTRTYSICVNAAGCLPDADDYPYLVESKLEAVCALRDEYAATGEAEPSWLGVGDDLDNGYVCIALDGTYHLTAQEIDLHNAREAAIAYLTQDGGHLKVPCSRYGDTSSECAPVAYAAAKHLAQESEDPLTLASLDYMMGLVVNDHDDIERFLGEECPYCGDRDTRYTGATPNGEWQEWRCHACSQPFKVLPEIEPEVCAGTGEHLDGSTCDECASTQEMDHERNID